MGHKFCESLGPLGQISGSATATRLCVELDLVRFSRCELYLRNALSSELRFTKKFACGAVPKQLPQYTGHG